MHIHTLEKWQHSHDFAFIHEKGEKQTKLVLVITVLTMAAVIIAGTVFGSMALLADGWHMGTHAAAFAITLFAYAYTRRHAASKEFTFGTGKVSVLGGFASAIALAIVALFMGFESIVRFFTPHTILFNEAIAVAFLGLIVNLFCAYLLHGHHTHENNFSHKQDHSHHHDHNLRGAYLHVLADALTSILAIIALFSGKAFGWNWLDPLMGIVGAIVITRWSYGLLTDTSKILLDKNIRQDKIIEIQKRIEADSDNRVADIHIWKVGPLNYAAIISLVTHFPKQSEHYKNLISEFTDLTHVTIEVIECRDEPCLI